VAFGFSFPGRNIGETPAALDVLDPFARMEQASANGRHMSIDEWEPAAAS
jgi:hypothetical protein